MRGGFKVSKEACKTRPCSVSAILCFFFLEILRFFKLKTLVAHLAIRVGESQLQQAWGMNWGLTSI